MSEALEIDEYELKLQNDTSELKKCHEKKEVNSCLSCEEVLDCDIRKAYVESVYASMSKGQAGGFEF